MRKEKDLSSFLEIRGLPGLAEASLINSSTATGTKHFNNLMTFTLSINRLFAYTQCALPCLTEISIAGESRATEALA